MSYQNKKLQAYSWDAVNTLQGVTLPPKLKCDRCTKYVGHNNFSHRQLNDARYAIKRDGQGARYKIKCHKCCGGQLVEIECTMCNTVKGLEDFAKSQRSKGDSAKCMACIEAQVAREPVDEDGYEDPRNAFEPLKNSDGTFPDYWDPSTTTSNKSETGFNEDESTGGISLAISGLTVNPKAAIRASVMETDDRSENHLNGWGYVLQGNGPDTVKSRSWQSSGGSGLSSNKLGYSVVSGSASGTAETFNSTATERSETKPGGWAKIKAYNVPKQSVGFASTKSSTAVEDDWESDKGSNSDDDGNAAHDDDSDDSDTEI